MNKKPWEQCPQVWKTESAFWNYIRGVLRKGWSRFPVKIEYINLNRKQIANPNPKGKKPTVWGMTCQQCGKDTVQSNIEIDHVGNNASFTGLHDVESYVNHLFLVDFDSIESCCKSCHSIRSNAQSKGLTFEQSRIDKLVIEACKIPAAKQVARLEELGYNDTSNSEKRKNCWVDYFNKESHD